jgi:hypothetical protein
VQEEFSKGVKHSVNTGYFAMPRDQLIFFNLSLIIKDIGRQREKEKEAQQIDKLTDRIREKTTMETATDTSKNPFLSKKNYPPFPKKDAVHANSGHPSSWKKNLAANARNHHSGEAHA